ncbi:unnamed protein product [Ambrosiozyma monospora]|uniref:Unnamed protein product n=1 Tax=Ambrosiozyma monospora TaxID=43982 RepID=A0A9W6Z4Q7_AMBMO|nr:unnamed protein product [Ambrosiozyma monospora]
MVQFNKFYILNESPSDIWWIPSTVIADPFNKELKLIICVSIMNMLMLTLSQFIGYQETSDSPFFGWRLSFEKARFYKSCVLVMLCCSTFYGVSKSQSLAEVPNLLHIIMWVLAHFLVTGIRFFVEDFQAL